MPRSDRPWTDPNRTNASSRKYKNLHLLFTFCNVIHKPIYYFSNSPVNIVSSVTGYHTMFFRKLTISCSGSGHMGLEDALLWAPSQPTFGGGGGGPRLGTRRPPPGVATADELVDPASNADFHSSPEYPPFLGLLSAGYDWRWNTWSSIAKTCCTALTCHDVS